MFQSINFQHYLNKDNNRNYYYKLIDSDFEATVKIRIRGGVGPKLLLEIAKEYESRNLNAPANLAIYYKQQADKTPDWTLSKVIYYYTSGWPRESKKFCEKYLIDIRKYMALI